MPQTCTERIDIKKLRCLVKNINELKDVIGNCKDMKTYKKTDYDGTKTILKSYLGSKDKNGSSKVTYDFSKGNKDGRLFSKSHSLQGLPRSVRHTISSDNMIDVDIKNCHPEIFKWYCRNNAIACDNLCYYINNRENCLSDITNVFQTMTKDDAKTCVLSIINGGDGNIDVTKAPEWLRSLTIEVSNAHEKIAKNFPQYVSAVKKTKGEDGFNINGKVTNKMFCMYEGIILNHMAEFSRTSGLEIGSLCFDGLMIYKKEDFELEPFLANMETYVFNKVGIQLKIVQKHMTESIDLTGFNIEEEAPYIPQTEEEIGIYIVKKIIEDGNIFYSKKMNLTYVYNPETKLFEESCFEKIMTCISGYLIPLIDSELSLMIDSFSAAQDKKFQGLVKTFDKLRKDLQTTTFQKSVLTQIRIRIPDSEEFIEKTLNGIPHLFPIGANVINLKTLEIVPRTKQHFFTYTTNNTFKPDRPNKEIISNYIGELLKTENEEYITCFLTYLGYCLTNENCMKIFVVFNGDGDNGKSVFFNLFKSIIGNDTSVCVADKVFFSANAESVHSDEYLRLINKRVAYNNEIPDKAHWNEKFIKAVSGNDGKLSLRACGGRTIEPYITCKMISIGNYDQMPTFTDFQGFANRLKIFRFANKFEKNPKKANEIMSWKDDLFTEICWYAKNHFYDKDMNIDFPNEVEMATNEAKEDMDTIKGFFGEKVVMTENKDDRLPRPKLYSQYQGFCIENGLQRLMVGRATFNAYIIKNFKLEVYRDREWKGIKIRKDDCDSLMGCPM